MDWQTTIFFNQVRELLLSASSDLQIFRAVKLLLTVIVLLILLSLGLVFALGSNRELISVGSGYTAKTICSNAFLTQRSPEHVLASDVQAPGHPLLKLVRVQIDESAQTVSASLLGTGWAGATAQHRDGYGCALLHANTPAQPLPAITELPGTSSQTDANLAWPDGNGHSPMPSPARQTTLNLLVDAAMAEPGTRSVVVIHKGRLVAEDYAAGFDAQTRQLGWSLTKTVTSILTGMLVDDGLVSTEDKSLFPEWTDDRKNISLANLLHMESGLDFDESYGSVSDVTRMLFLEPDMAGFTVDRRLAKKPGTEFVYASGTSNVITRLLRDRVGDDSKWYVLPSTRLFSPLGMSSAIFETDASGNFVGSSYLYASARDWARLGLMLQQKGRWQNQTIISADWIDYMLQPAPNSDNEYGAHVWLRGEGGDKGFELPEDAFWLLGHDSQSIAVIPSAELVVVRLGLTPDGSGFKPQRFVQDLLQSGIFTE